MIREKKQGRSKLTHPLRFVRWFLRGAKTYALVGKSGTGKSFRARLVAERCHADIILDDGLLIKNDKIIAGKSSKREEFYVGAIKTALYDDEAHRREAIQILRETPFKKILVVSTSRKMVKRIVDRLELPPVTKWIAIEEIASREEIEKAGRDRKVGKHVIPVPGIEVKRDYAHILTDTIRIFLEKRKWHKRSTNVVEKSIVRPRFEEQRKGGVQITRAALMQMILHCIDELSSPIEVRKIVLYPERAGYRITLLVKAFYGQQMGGDLHKLRNYISNKIERFTGMAIEEINITVSEFLA